MEAPLSRGRVERSEPACSAARGTAQGMRGSLEGESCSCEAEVRNDLFVKQRE